MRSYDTEVRHRGKVFVIHTAIMAGRVHTQLLDAAGNVIASTEGTCGPDAQLRMRESHRAMFIALRDGKYDRAEPIPSS